MYEKEPIQNYLACNCISFTWNRRGRCCTSGSADNAVPSSGIFLLRERIRAVPPVVCGNETVPESSGQFCKRPGDDAEDKAVHPPSGISHADLRRCSHAEYSGTYLHCVSDSV